MNGWNACRWGRTAGPATAVALLAALLAAGCGGDGESDALTFAVGGTPAELEVWEQLVAEFEAETGIAVELRRQPTDSNARRQSLVTSLRAGQRDPDVFLMDVAWLAQFAASRWLQPLEGPLVEREIDPAVFYGTVRPGDDGALVALPVYVDGGLLYYRTDLLAELGYDAPPQTWTELREMARAAQRRYRPDNPDFFGYVWQGAQYEGLICHWLEVAGSNGGGFGPGLRVDGAANVEATATMAGWIHDEPISPPNTFTEMKEEPVRRAFQAGNALFERNWPYAWSLHQRAESPVAGKVALAPLPHFDGGRSMSALGGWHIGVSRHCDRTDEAMHLLAYIVSYPAQKRVALELGWNPGRRDVYQDPDVLEPLPHLASLRGVFEKLTPRPAVPYYPAVSDAIQRHLNAALAGRVPPDEALRAAQDEIDTIKQRYGD
ncbi:MAG: ABC transporter substrate-binding protein [Planctomycetota bacterium]